MVLHSMVAPEYSIVCMCVCVCVCVCAYMNKRMYVCVCVGVGVVVATLHESCNCVFTLEVRIIIL